MAQMRTVLALLCSLSLPVGAAVAEPPGGVVPSAEGSQAVKVRDLLWVWGNPEMATPGSHTTASFAEAGPAERARLLGVPNVILAGQGLPNDDQEAGSLMRQVAAAPRVVWEIGPDGEGENRPFVYTQRLAQVRRLADAYPRVEGVLLDDMSTVGIDRGFRPEHIRGIRELLPGRYRSVRIWGVVYTMSFERAGLGDYVRELDVISLWAWHAKDTVRLAQNVAECAQRFPGKPMVLGLYLFDYGDGRQMPADLLEAQCRTGLGLLQEGRVSGLVFLTITNDAAAVAWTARWIAEVGALPVFRAGGPQ
jgi:hypothetical protein